MPSDIDDLKARALGVGRELVAVPYRIIGVQIPGPAYREYKIYKGNLREAVCYTLQAAADLIAAEERRQGKRIKEAE